MNKKGMATGFLMKVPLIIFLMAYAVGGLAGWGLFAPPWYVSVVLLGGALWLISR